MKTVPISQVQLDLHNPRTITKEKFQELKTSITDFPEMELVKPLIVADGFVIGGNMRLLAMKDLGYREVKIIDVTEWSQAKRDEFMIKDNTHYGSWDYDALANEWHPLPLTEWGVAVWEPEEEKEKAEESTFSTTIKIEFQESGYITSQELIEAIRNSNAKIEGFITEA